MSRRDVHTQSPVRGATIDQRSLLAPRVVERRIVVCVQVSSPITSRYTWKGKPEASEEYRLMMKTRPPLKDAALAALRELHPYEIPELIVTLVETTHAYATSAAAETQE